MRKIRLRDGLLLRLLLPMCAVLLVSGILSYALALKFARASFDHSLLETARGVAQQVQVRNHMASIELPRAAIEMLIWDGEDHIHYQVASQRQGIIAGDGQLPPPASDESQDRPTFYDTSLNGEGVRAVSLRVTSLESEDRVMVRIAETKHKREALTDDIVAAVVVPQLLLILFAALSIWKGVKVGLAPLERLANAVNTRRRDDPTPLPVTDVPLETRPLIDAFNGLLGRLGEALTAQQRFIADAAHQLRTPLASLKVQLERTLREQDPSMREQALQQLLESVERTARLSNQLLLMARAEPGASMSHQGRVDLRALAFDTGSRWVPRALQCGHDLGFAGSEVPVWVKGDALLLGELINNLIDNALRYGGPRITLKVEQASDFAPELSVEDNGQGISPEERERVFQRFHRVPGSAGNGSGLGLAIVREIAQNHAAEALLECPEEGGTRIRIRFPINPAGQS